MRYDSEELIDTISDLDPEEVARAIANHYGHDVVGVDTIEPPNGEGFSVEVFYKENRSCTVYGWIDDSTLAISYRDHKGSNRRIGGVTLAKIFGAHTPEGVQKAL